VCSAMGGDKIDRDCFAGLSRKKKKVLMFNSFPSLSKFRDYSDLLPFMRR
jgi:hypothetical protein